MSDTVERLRQYRPRDEWGDPVKHTICDEAATEIEALRRENQELRAALNECQAQAVKDGNAIANLKAWQAGAISCREAEEERISEYKNSVIAKDELLTAAVDDYNDARSLAFEEAALLVEAQWNHCWPSDIAAAIRALTMSDIHREQLDRPRREAE